MKSEQQLAKEQDADQKVLDANVRTLCETRQGREFIWRVLSLCGIYSSIPGEFAAGERNIGIGVIDILDSADPTLYANLILENIENERQN